MDEDVRKTLLWICEQTVLAPNTDQHGFYEPVCVHCGHALRFHLADRTYASCMYPKADIRLCKCQDYQGDTDDDGRQPDRDEERASADQRGHPGAGR